ncbi:HNH endonuclease signature motif containing protein [Sphingobium baderi]|uniref:HNH endonuclease signature motif containing protein n=1 Tax=Sphingobium baderi TaxID=1332080 RepID=UPI003B588147
MCRGCADMGRLTVANTVDHVQAISDGGPAFPGHDGLRSYCPACHSAKTARGTEAGAIRSTKPRRGCNPDGTPLDPAHPWAGKSLRADGIRPARNPNIELVAKGNRNGR